jgi:tetratricopeptide (TPR) repeat protein
MATGWIGIPAGDKATLELALKFHDDGELTAAMALYRALLQSHPDQGEIWGLLGSALRMTGEAAEAVQSLENGVNHAPDRFDMKAELAIAMSEAGQHAEAADKLNGLLPVLRSSGQDEAVVYAALGDVSLALENYRDAIAHYRTALEKDPDNAVARENLATALHSNGQFDEAIATCREMLATDPDNFSVLTSLGAALRDSGRPEESLEPLKHAIALEPHEATAMASLGVSLRRLKRKGEAETAFRGALSRDPADAASWNALAELLRDDFKLTEALRAHKSAIKADDRDPDLHLNHARTLMLSGDLERGFAELEWRKAKREFAGRPIEGPAWDGAEAMGKTLLLHTEGGLGDTIKFSRYALQLALSGATVILACPEPLAGLLATLDGPIGTVTSLDDAPPYDFHASLMSLPHLMHTTLATIPSETPYLCVPPETVSPLPADAERRRIGIAWASDSDHPADESRSAPLHRLSPMFDLPRTEWICLQTGPPAEDLTETYLPITDITPALGDFARIAAVIAELDLVISVDGAVAHLAGALGQPVWLILPHMPDEGWMTGRTDSPWYPTMRLFRQPRPADWQSVAFDVRTALREHWQN